MRSLWIQGLTESSVLQVILSPLVYTLNEIGSLCRVFFVCVLLLLNLNLFNLIRG